MNGVVPLGGIRVIDRHAEAQHVRALLCARKDQPVTDLPIVGVFRLALQQPFLDNAILGDVEGNLLVANPLAAAVSLSRLSSCIVAKQAVQPLDVNRIQDVFNGLHPIAGGNRMSYFTPTIFFNQQIPPWHQRRRLGPQVCEDQATQLFDGIMAESNLVFERVARMSGLFKRLLEAPAQAVKFPPVIGTPQAILLRNAVNQIGSSMGAVSIDQTEPSLPVFE